MPPFPERQFFSAPPPKKFEEGKLKESVIIIISIDFPAPACFPVLAVRSETF